MRTSSEMSLLFPTNFSDSCFRSIPAIAHWIDDLGCRLTLLHAYDPRRTSHDAAGRQLQSFFAEAEHYGYCHRLAVPSESPEIAIREHCEEYSHDLLVVPGGEHVGPPRLGPSLRARLQQYLPVPIWTVDEPGLLRRTPGRPRHIACWLQDFSGANLHLNAAASLAERLGAKLHLFYVLPDVHEGMLGAGAGLGWSGRPLGEESARVALQMAAKPLSVTPEFHVGRGDFGRELREMVSANRVDLLVAGEKQVLQGGLFGLRLRDTVRNCSCPVICMDGASSDLDNWPRPERSSAWRPIPSSRWAEKEREILALPMASGRS